MKKISLIMAVGLTLAMTGGVRSIHVLADDEGIPLSRLAGTFSTKFTGYSALCFTGSPPRFAACTTAGAFAMQFDVAIVGTATIDEAGNICQTAVSVSALHGGSTSTTSGSTRHYPATITAYDPATRTGDYSFTQYIGGRCVGARFDSTGARAITLGTIHFVVSDNGDRIDAVTTSVVATPVNFFGSSVVTATEHRLGKNSTED